MSKGSQRRPSQVSKEEYTLRWNLYMKKITFKEFEKKLKKLKKGDE